jgi:hypothetical protein
MISGIIKEASTSLEPILPDLNGHIWIGLNIAHPLRLKSMLGEEIDAPLIADKPDFDGTGLPSVAANCG